MGVAFSIIIRKINKLLIPLEIEFFFPPRVFLFKHLHEVAFLLLPESLFQFFLEAIWVASTLVVVAVVAGRHDVAQFVCAVVVERHHVVGVHLIHRNLAPTVATFSTVFAIDITSFASCQPSSFHRTTHLLCAPHCTGTRPSHTAPSCHF